MSEVKTVDWADEMAKSVVCWWESHGDSIRFRYEYEKHIAHALRSVERRTAEDIQLIIEGVLLGAYDNWEGSTESVILRAIRERFHLEGK